MKTILILIISSLFVSTISKSKENEPLDKAMLCQIEKTEKIKVESLINHRTPIIIVKRD